MVDKSATKFRLDKKPGLTAWNSMLRSRSISRLRAASALVTVSAIAFPSNMSAMEVWTILCRLRKTRETGAQMRILAGDVRGRLLQARSLICRGLSDCIVIIGMS